MNNVSPCIGDKAFNWSESLQGGDNTFNWSAFHSQPPCRDAVDPVAGQLPHPAAIKDWIVIGHIYCSVVPSVITLCFSIAIRSIVYYFLLYFLT